MPSVTSWADVNGKGMEAGTTVDAAADAFLARDHPGFTIDPQRVHANMQAIYDGQ